MVAAPRTTTITKATFLIIIIVPDTWTGSAVPERVVLIITTSQVPTYTLTQELEPLIGKLGQ